MPAPLLIPLIIKGICWCGTALATAYVCKKGHDAYKQGQKTKREKYGLKSKSIEAAQEDNKKAQAEADEWKQKYDEIEQREKKRDIEIQNIQEKLKDPNLTDKKRGELEEHLASLLAGQEDDKKEKDKILKLIKGLGDRIKNNNNIISNASSNPDDKHWIWEFLTLENILIMGACYAMYKVLKDDK